MGDIRDLICGICHRSNIRDGAIIRRTSTKVLNYFKIDNLCIDCKKTNADMLEDVAIYEAKKDFLLGKRLGSNRQALANK